MNLENINQSLSQLKDIRKELSDPSSIRALARILKRNSQKLDISSKNDSLSLSALPGLYYFEAKFDFETLNELDAFGENWGRIRNANLPPGIPRYYPNRAKHHSKRIERKGFIPFYLGKRKDISGRIIGHLDGLEEAGTYSLKFRSRPDVIKNIEFRYSFCTFDIDPECYYGIEILESRLRELFNPIIGKQ